MKVRLLFFLFLINGWLPLRSQNYLYEVDLAELKDDRLKVELSLEGFNKQSLTYHFPKIIPGTYAVQDFGKYIEDFRAFDKEGNSLKVKKKGKNSYFIKDGISAHKVTYFVNDTWDSNVRKNKVFTPAGTSFHQDKHFFLNTPGLFGYFQGETDNPIEIHFKNPGDLYGSSAMKSRAGENQQVFTADSYFELTDSPILFAIADTASFRIGNCTVRIAGRHSKGKKIANEILPIFKESMEAIEGFFDEFPSDEYTFLIYVKDARPEMEPIMEKPGIIPIVKLAMKYPGVGALEHNKSSTYFLLDLGELPNTSLFNSFHYEKLLKSVAIHEFMHTLTPLQLRTEYIDNFDFQNPEMSQHLWLYEGVTEYFAGIIPVKAGQMKPEVYLNKVVKEKWEASRSFPNKRMSFTEMSANVLRRKYHKKYDQVYQYGAVLALCLDLEIMKLTNGDKDLRGVLVEMTKEYNESNPIPENELFKIMVERTHPGLQDFIDKFIRGNDELLINHYLHYAGVRYFLFEEVLQSIPLVSPEYGIRKIEQNPWRVLINGKITVKEVTEGSPFKVGDNLNFFEFQNQVKDEYGFDKMEEGETVTLNVVNNGETRSVSFPLKYREMTKSDHYRIDEDTDEKKLKIRQKWWNY